jgi:hypothetical protein
MTNKKIDLSDLSLNDDGSFHVESTDLDGIELEYAKQFRGSDNSTCNNTSDCSGTHNMTDCTNTGSCDGTLNWTSCSTDIPK